MKHVDLEKWMKTLATVRMAAVARLGEAVVLNNEQSWPVRPGEPANAERFGYHWIELDGRTPFPCLWIPGNVLGDEDDGYFMVPVDPRSLQFYAEPMAFLGSYLKPLPMPAGYDCDQIYRERARTMRAEMDDPAAVFARFAATVPTPGTEP
jgi:hypothetical protein